MEDEEPRHELTIAEKRMVVKCYRFFELEKSMGNYRGDRTRELVHKCIGVKPATVARVRGAYNRNPQHFFEDLENQESSRGRKRGFSVEAIAPTIKDYIVSQNKEAIPTTAQQIANYIDFSMIKDELIKIVDKHRPKPIYRAQELAVQYGHLLYYTPPYHPTLQPIELIWAQVKAPIARNPANNASETIQKVEDGLDAAEDQWVSVFRRIQKNEDAFVQAAASNSP